MRSRPILKWLASVWLFLAGAAWQVEALDPSLPATSYTLEHWGPREGFPEETIFAITQTSDGYLWMATPLGLVRFDGREFKFWDHHRVPGLEALRAASLMAAADGSLWMRNADGVVWRHDRGRFEKILGADERDRVQWFGRDAQDRVWIVTADAVHRWIGGRMERDVFRLDRWRDQAEDWFLDRKCRLWLRLRGGGLVRLSETGKVEREWRGATAPPSFVQSMVEDSNGSLWLAAAEGLFQVEDDAIRRVRGAEPVRGETIRLRLDAGALWICSDRGLSRVYRGKWETILEHAKLDRASLETMFTDREGSLWLGSMRDGLYRVKDSKFANLTRDEGLSSSQILAVFRDSQDRLWVGTDTGVDRRSLDGLIRRFSTTDGVPAGGVRAIAQDRDGRIWLGGMGGLAVEDRERFRPVRIAGRTSSIRAIAENRHGGIWAVTSHGLAAINENGVQWLQTPAGMRVDATRQLHDTARFGLLVSMWQGGLWQCKGEQCDDIIRGENGGKRVSIFGTLVDSDGVLWVVSSKGLGRLVPHHSTGRLEPEWLNVSAHLSYPEPEFYQIGDEGDGRLWLAARRSLVRIDRPVDGTLNPASVRQYDLHDGMWSANFGVARQGWKAASPGGVLWFPNMVGLVGVDASRIRENPLPPPVNIEQVLADGKQVEAGDRIVLDAGTDRVEVIFAGLSLFNPSKVRYRYKLEAFDQEWIEAGGNNRAMYMRLGQGNYRFRVKASNNDGVWNEDGASLEFRVEPQIWQRTGFRWIAGLLLVVAVALAYRLRTRSLMDRNIELERRVKERTAELERARQQAEEGARAKSDFLATMSHEIRTPMNGVLGMVSLLEKTTLTQEQQACTEIIAASGQGLLAVLNDVLDLSRIEAGKIDIHRVPIDIYRLCDQVVGLFRHIAEAKGLRLSLTWPEGLRPWYMADESRTRQVLVNLVGNAVKFTERGFVDLAVTATKNSDGRWNVVFAVRDSGIGLTQEQLSRLFQKFSQADSSAARKYGGTGLGLVISKGLAEHMGGRLEAESQVDAGSCFRFVIPMEPTGQPPERPAENAPPALTAIRHDQPILLAEDNTVNIMVARGMLARLGFQAKVVKSGREVLAAIEKETFGLILMDCQMPELDGYETTRLIRARYPDSGPVIVAMTANAMEGDRERCLAAGMDDYIAKPVVLRDLASCLDHWIGKSAAPASDTPPVIVTAADPD